MVTEGTLRELVAKEKEEFYFIKVYPTTSDEADEADASPAGGGRKAGAAADAVADGPHLLTSIPCAMAANVDDFHDILEVTVTPFGKIAGINYRTRPAWGLALFEHTAVQLSRGMFVPPPLGLEWYIQ